MEIKTEMVELSVEITNKLMARIRREAATREMTVAELVRDVMSVWLADSLADKPLDVEQYLKAGTEGNMPEALEHGDQIRTRQRRETDARNSAIYRARAKSAAKGTP